MVMLYVLLVCYDPNAIDCYNPSDSSQTTKIRRRAGEEDLQWSRIPPNSGRLALSEKF